MQLAQSYTASWGQSKDQKSGLPIPISGSFHPQWNAGNLQIPGICLVLNIQRADHPQKCYLLILWEAEQQHGHSIQDESLLLGKWHHAEHTYMIHDRGISICDSCDNCELQYGKHLFCGLQTRISSLLRDLPWVTASPVAPPEIIVDKNQYTWHTQSGCPVMQPPCINLSLYTPGGSMWGPWHPI